MASFNEYLANTFPNVSIIKDNYEFVQLNGENFSRTEGGAPIIRRLYTTSRYDITVVAVGFRAEDVLALRAKYNDEPEDLDTMTDPATGAVYNVVWIEAPETRDIKGVFYTVQFRFDGALQ